MARKVRIEYAGACYHVINRGNYRSWIFESEGARVSFLKCLQEACEGMGWRLHAWVLMGNHYHLCLETPEANLVEGNAKGVSPRILTKLACMEKPNGLIW